MGSHRIILACRDFRECEISENAGGEAEQHEEPCAENGNAGLHRDDLQIGHEE